MVKNVQIAAFEGGALRVLASGDGGREAVLALPLSRFLVRMVRVPAETDPVAFATPLLKAMSPFPDDPLTVSCEKVRETDRGTVVIAIAMPEGSADDIAEALDQAKLSVVRVDALVLGVLRGLWGSISGEGRRMLLFRSVDCISVIVMDGDQPSSIRAVADVSDLRREAMLSLLEAEDFGGPGGLVEVVAVNGDFGDLSFLGVPVREISVGDDAGLIGVRERSETGDSLDALPDSWRDVLLETRFKARLVRNLTAAVGVWVLVMAVLFGVPFAYGYMTGYQKDQCRLHSDQYKAVSEKKAKVRLVQKYSDHARGALEIMKAVSDRLPTEVTLLSYDFKGGDGVRVKGESTSSGAIYKFKDSIDAMAAEAEGEDVERVFKQVTLGALNSSQKDGTQKFELECKFEEPEE